MKKLISLLLCAFVMMTLLPAAAMAEADDEWICGDCHIWVSGEYCPQCTKARASSVNVGSECVMTFNVAFEKNTFFSRYDVEILINGTKVFTVQHGEALDGTVVVPKGQCELVFRNAKDPTEDVRFSLKLVKDTTFSCDMSAHFYGLSLTNVKCDAFQGSQQLGVNEPGTRNGARMTLLGTTKSRGNGVNVPADGYVFVWVEFEVSNITGRTLTFRPDSEFSVYCDGYTIQASNRSAAAAPMGFASRLGGGEKMKAMLCFELPANWKELKVVYGDEALVYDRLVYVINNK